MAYGACDSADASHAKRVTFWIGPDGIIKKAYPNVDAAKQPEELLREIDA